jgi:cyanate permease
MFLAVSRIQAEVLLIQQWFSGTRIATINSITVGSFGIGQIVAIGGIPLLLPLLGGWRGVHIALAGVYLVIAIAWLVVGREREYQRSAESPPQNGSSPLGALRRHPVLFLLASTQIGGAIAWASFLTFFPTYGVEVHGLTLVAVGSLFVVFPIGGVIGAFSAGYLSNLARRRKPFIFLPGFLMPVLYLGVLTVSPSGWIPLLIALGFTSSIVVPIVLTFPYDLGLSPREVAVAVGLVRTITPLGASLGPIVTGVLQETTGSLELALTIILPMSVTVGIIGLFLPETSPLRRRRREAVT